MPGAKTKRKEARAAATVVEDEVEDVSQAEGPSKPSAPTAQLLVMRLQEELCALKEERDFLRQQLKLALERPHSAPTPGTERMDSEMRSDSDSSSTFSSSTSSDARGKKKRKTRHTKSGKHAQFGKIMKTPEDVVNRYWAVLKTFKKTRSVTRSCERHDVDRNTIAMTAVIAEVYVAATEEEVRIPKFSGSQLMSYAKECKAFFDNEPQLQEKIKQMKANAELLPVAYKVKS